MTSFWEFGVRVNKEFVTHQQIQKIPLRPFTKETAKLVPRFRTFSNPQLAHSMATDLFVSTDKNFFGNFRATFLSASWNFKADVFFGFLRQLFRTPTTKLSHTGLPAISFHKSLSSPKPQSNPRSSPALRASRNVTARFFLESSRIETRITCGKYREVSIMIINYMSLSAPI